MVRILTAIKHSWIVLYGVIKPSTSKLSSKYHNQLFISRTIFQSRALLLDTTLSTSALLLSFKWNRWSSCDVIGCFKSNCWLGTSVVEQGFEIFFTVFNVSVHIHISKKGTINANIKPTRSNQLNQ